MTALRLTAISTQRQHFHGNGTPKVAHLTEQEATGHLARLVAKDPDIEANVYECGFCGAWHVGNNGLPR